MAISHAKSVTVADGTNTNIVRPGDWNSVHNQFYTLSGNTLNASTASGTNVVLQGAGGVSLGGSTGTIFISAPQQNTDKLFPAGPAPLASSTFVSGTSGGTGGSTQFTVSGYVAPLYLQNPLSYHEVEMIVSGQATSAGTGSASNGYMLGIYSNNASTLSLVTSYQWAYVMSQNSISAQTHSWWWGTNSTSNSSSLSGNVSASFTRVAQIVMNNSASTLSAGTYYVGVIHTNRTSSLAIGGNSSAMCYSLSQSTGASYFGAAQYLQPYDERFHGQFSTTMNAANTGLFSMPSAINGTAITGTGGSSQLRIPFVRFYASNT